jgi:uncharacterized protein YhfF
MDVIANDYLKTFLSSLPQRARDQYSKFDAYHFCADEENANICANLVLNGEKRATASLLWAYQAENEPLPEVGHLSVITNWENEPKCIIEITSVEICPFEDVTPEFAFEEGEGDKSLDFWRTEHWKYFTMECEDLGMEPRLEMPVVLERFKVVYRE